MRTSPVFWVVLVADAILAIWVAAALVDHVPWFLDGYRGVVDFVAHWWAKLGRFIEPFLILSAAVTFFWVWRRWTVVRRYRKRAKTQPKELVQTAGSILDDVVGRDELCQNLIDDLRSDDRRVHVLQGGVGAGKTAVMVEMTKQLAKRGAVPINIRLRDAQDPALNFSALALERFKEEVRGRFYPDADAERMFRLLRRYDQVVVLADGLEEALIEEEREDGAGGAVAAAGHVKDRDSIIRLAIRRAQSENLPLVVTSRPQDSLRAMDAVIVELEPLGERPALDYVQQNAEPRHFHQLARMVQHTDVAYAPLYLNLARRLYREARPLWNELAGPTDESRSPTEERVDKAEIRLRMFDQWKKAVREGHLYRDYALKTDQRDRAIECLSALACVGLMNESQEVKLEELVGKGARADSHQTRLCKDDEVAEPDDMLPLADYQRNLLNALAPRFKQEELTHNLYRDGVRKFWLSRLRMAATMGHELGIVEAKQDSIRFRHSLMHAYLGSRFLPEVITDDMYCRVAMNRLSKEFLIALVLGSRSTTNVLPEEAHGARIPLCLADRADNLIEWDAAHALNAYAAAFEIDSKRGGKDHAALAWRVAKKWKDVQSDEDLDRALVDARTDLLTRMGDAARWIAMDKVKPDPQWTFRNRARISSYFEDVVLTEGGLVLTSGALPVTQEREARNNYRSFYEIACSEKDYPLRLAVAQQIGDGADEAFDQLIDEFNERWKRDRQPGHGISARQPVRRDSPGLEDEQLERTLRERMVCAWLAPLMFFSSRKVRPDSLDNVKRWVDDLATADPNHPERQPNIQAEIALAQGFKHAANKRGDPYARERIEPYEHGRKRTVLIELAESALAHSRFWFSHLTLLQALTLLSLPDDPGGELPRQGHGSDPRAVVNYWVGLAGSRAPGVACDHKRAVHPFVREAADLAALALTSRRPQHFVWIDESGVVSQVGSGGTPYTTPTDQLQWILPSVGWATLHPTAQRLVADVLLLLNLAERGDNPDLRDERLRRADRADVPPCLTRARDQLAVNRTVGSVDKSEPGTNCIDDCPFRLCPYPPIGEPSYRAELREALCRKLAAEPSDVRWQKKLSHRELKDFWTAMARRNVPNPGEPTY